MRNSRLAHIFFTVFILTSCSNEQNVFGGRNIPGALDAAGLDGDLLGLQVPLDLEIYLDKKETIKSLCSYGYVEELLGNHKLAKEKMDECANWASENSIKKSDDYPGDVAYQTIWPLYLYYKNINKLEKASKYLAMSYDTIGKKAKDK